MDELKLYNRKELASLMGCCTKTVGKLMRSGELVVVPINKKSAGVPVWSFRQWQEKHSMYKEASHG